MTAQMKRSRLVQRLRRPLPGEGTSSGPFAFGGGLRNGGLREEALELLAPLWRFDYMGAAEFEFGAVPEALQRIAKAAEETGLAAGSFRVKVSEVQPHWDELPRGARPETKSRWPKTDEVRTLWYLCPRGWEAEVANRVYGWAVERWNQDLKEETRLAGTLRPHHDWERDETQPLGWLELDNGFMFFADEEMWRGTCALFGVETGEEGP